MIVPPTTQWESNYHAATMALARIQRLLVEADDEFRSLTPVNQYVVDSMASIAKWVDILEKDVEVMHERIMGMVEDAT